MVKMEEEKNAKCLKDLLLSIAEVWERSDCAEVRGVGEPTRAELEVAALNNNITSQQYCAPDLSSTSQDPQTEEIFQQVL